MQSHDDQIHIGPITVYRDYAQCWAVKLHTRRWGWLCLRLPIYSCGVLPGPAFWASPNGAPWAATIFKGGSPKEAHYRVQADQRRMLLGHNFDPVDVGNATLLWEISKS